MCLLKAHQYAARRSAPPRGPSTVKPLSVDDKLMPTARATALSGVLRTAAASPACGTTKTAFGCLHMDVFKLPRGASEATCSNSTGVLKVRILRKKCGTLCSLCRTSTGKHKYSQSRT